MRKSREYEGTKLGLVSHALVGAGIAFAFSLLILFAAAGLVAHGTLPPGLMNGVTVLVAAIASLLGGFVAIRRNGKGKAMIVGLAQAGMFYVFTLVGGAFAPGSLFGPISLFLFIAILASGAVAGILSVRQKSRRKF